jgi:hypothetical protein
MDQLTIESEAVRLRGASASRELQSYTLISTRAARNFCSRAGYRQKKTAAAAADLLELEPGLLVL